MPSQPVLQVNDLTTCFDGDETTVLAVDGLSFDLMPGETLGLVGESGCGKSVTSLSIMRLLRTPGRVARGSVEFDGRDLLALPEKAMRAVRGNQLSMIFQEPMTSLNPVFTIGRQISEPLMLHQGLSRREAMKQAEALLELVQISDPARRVHEYPYQLSEAPARHDRHGAGVPAQGADRRRADHRAGRHHPGADPAPAARHPGAAGHGHRADHPRSGRGGADVPAGHRHVRRAQGRGRQRRRRAGPCRPSLYPGADPLAARLRRRPGPYRPPGRGYPASCRW
ncbi:ATP-binding cassette domain-containing protein [Achromobacter insuavis]